MNLLSDSAFEPLVTEEMVTAASSRAIAVEASCKFYVFSQWPGRGQTNSYFSDAAIEYSPQNLHDALHLIANRLGVIEQQGKIGLAQTFNARVISKNKHLRGPLQLEPLQKVVGRAIKHLLWILMVATCQVEGYGRDTALLFIHPLNAANQAAFNNEFPENPPEDQISAIGSTPPHFDPRVEGYSHLDVLRMVAFYNESFNIVPQDNLPDRIDKFRRYLTEY